MEPDHHGIVIIEGQSFPITHQMYTTMPLFEESELIGNTTTHTIDAITLPTWLQLLTLLDCIHYQIPQPPPTVNSNDPRQYIGKELSDLLGTMNN